jgi:glycosyltransferase involved in cell wall biosynthesis
MRILFALPGLHRCARGAETAFISVATELAKAGETVTLIGSGRPNPEAPYRFVRAASMAREKFESLPSIPGLRNECAYEELTFIPHFLYQYRRADYDITVTCSYPFTNLLLRLPSLRKVRPPHIFVTQNGDFPARTNKSEYRLFGCEGLVCTNPDYYERNQRRWRCQLIPNGVDCVRFQPRANPQQCVNIPKDRFIVLMVSALVPDKRVDVGIKAISRIPEAHLWLAGDGPLRQAVDELAARLLPGRFKRFSVPPEHMPSVYQSADVFLHLSMEESFGNVFLEAMACGLPVVAHDSYRVRWIVGNDEFLLNTKDSAAIAAHIKLARESSPDKQKQRVARAATFSWVEIAAMYRVFFREVIASRTRSLRR